MEIITQISENLMKYIQTASIIDVLDILIVAYLVYKIMTLTRGTSAAQVIKAILIVLVISWISELLRLNVINFILRNAVQLGMLAIVIMFQPELRRILEQLGRSRLPNLIGKEQARELEVAVTQTVIACSALSWARHGALIVFERGIILSDIIKTGTIMDARVSSELFKNIFYPKAPLHDGAVIIREGRIAGAGCMLPLSENKNLSRDIGMRHKAGIGMSENSDAVVIIVSEETGSISVSVGGMLKRHLAQETLEQILRVELLPRTDEDKASKGFSFFKWLKGERK